MKNTNWNVSKHHFQIKIGIINLLLNRKITFEKILVTKY